MARESLCHTAALGFEAALTWYWPERRWRPLVEGSEQLEPLRAALRSGEKGVLLLVPHLGNWEVMALQLGEFDFVSLYDPPRIASLEAPIRKARERTGAVMAPITAQGIRSVYQKLKTGGLVTILPDQVPDANAGVYAPFYGHPALTMTLAHRLLSRTGARVFMSAMLRTERGVPN